MKRAWSASLSGEDEAVAGSSERVARSLAYGESKGYRTLRVAGRVTFRLSGRGKSVFWLVGTNYEDGQILLLAG